MAAQYVGHHEHSHAGAAPCISLLGEDTPAYGAAHCKRAGSRHHIAHVSLRRPSRAVRTRRDEAPKPSAGGGSGQRGMARVEPINIGFVQGIVKLDLRISGPGLSFRCRQPNYRCIGALGLHSPNSAKLRISELKCAYLEICLQIATPNKDMSRQYGVFWPYGANFG